MKLAKVEHERCSEWSGDTYVWVPHDWTEDQFQDAVHAAEDAYIAFCKEWMEAGKDAPNKATTWSKPEYGDYPDKTVAEVDALWEEMRAEYKAWEAVRNKGKKSFKEFLTAEGIVDFYDREPDLEVRVYWGHRHGWPLDYSQDGVHKNDFKGPHHHAGEDKPLRRVRVVRRAGSGE